MAGIYLGILSNRWSFNDFIWLYAFNFHEDIPDNYYESKDFAIEDTLHILMSDESKQLIEGKRDSALIAHRIYKTKHSYTPAEFVFKGDTMKGKLRLKGDIVDHLRSDR